MPIIKKTPATCIFHSRDLDGFSSAAIVKLKYPDVKLVGYDYNEPIPWDKITAGEPVIMVDVSFKMEDMAALSVHSDYQFTWIDHHVSAINEFNEKLGNADVAFGLQHIVSVLENGIAACEGTWKYLFPDKLMPKAIELLGKYDTWRNQNKTEWEMVILPFQFGMRLKCNSAETFPMQLINEEEHLQSIVDGQIIERIIKKGLTILEYQAMVNESACKKSAFECQFEGLRVIALNGGGFNSDVFKSVYDQSKHDVMMPFQFNGKEWIISMYTTKDIDLSVIARKYKGGGHARACGFSVPSIGQVFGVIDRKRIFWENQTA